MDLHTFLIYIITIGEPSQSHLTDSVRHKQRSQSVRQSDPLPPLALSLYKYLVARQKSIKNLFNRGAIKETMGRLISKFFIYESVVPHKADSHHFKNNDCNVHNKLVCENPFSISNNIIILHYSCKPYNYLL